MSQLKAASLLERLHYVTLISPICAISLEWSLNNLLSSMDLSERTSATILPQTNNKSRTLRFKLTRWYLSSKPNHKQMEYKNSAGIKTREGRKIKYKRITCNKKDI